MSTHNDDAKLGEAFIDLIFEVKDSIDKSLSYSRQGRSINSCAELLKAKSGVYKILKLLLEC